MENIEINQRLIQFVLFIPLFLLSLTVHELAHAYTAYRFGDNTAKHAGRLTFNPMKHLDLIGSIVLPLMSFLSGFALIGWAKPVPVNPNNFKNPYKDDAIVSAAGPTSNFLLAIVFFILFIIIEKNPSWNSLLVEKILWMGVYFNIFLFLFNLLPIPPLDGSHIVFDLFPNKFTAMLGRLGMYGTIMLFIFIYSPLWSVFMGIIQAILNLFLTIAEYI